ncbi:SsrA-binding protein [Desulfonema magnum]|uniref:SsrA-binding protein n=2 Tax=Desulfonema magnum TaxID=45655 RepID=A0A975GPZ8_9BACT|nr:SsrA-binding protein [Desulfonema magnum]
MLLYTESGESKGDTNIMEKRNIKMVTENRKARHDYSVIDQYEAGMVLSGTEVKSLRVGRAHLKDSYAKIKNGEVFVHQMHIGPYPFAYYGNHDPLRPRKLLLHNHEIKKLIGKVKEKGFSLIPLRVYFKNGKAKMAIALAKGKKSHDKREAIRRRDEQRYLERERKDF